MANFLIPVQLNASALKFNHVCSGFELNIAAGYHAGNLNQAHTPAPQVRYLYTCCHGSRRQVMVLVVSGDQILTIAGGRSCVNLTVTPADPFHCCSQLLRADSVLVVNGALNEAHYPVANLPN